MAISLVTGWTSPIDYILKADGTAVNLTGMTVAIQVYGRSGNTLSVSGAVEVTSPTTGAVRFTPASSDISRSRSLCYEVRFKVTDSNGKIAYFPNGAAEVWNIQ